MKPNWMQRLFHALTAPVDALPQRVFECCCTLAFLVMLGFNFWEWKDWLTGHGFHLNAQEAAALGYPSPFPTLPAWLVPLFAIGTLAASLAVMLNRHRRMGLWLLFAAAVYAQGVDYLSTSAQNKICIALFALLATAPGFQRNPQTNRLEISRVLPLALMLTLVIIYWAAGWTKAFGTGAWLDHEDTLKLAVAGFHRTELAAWALRVLPDFAWLAAQYGTLIFEIGAPLWFFWRKTRLWAVLAGVSLHLGIALMMRNVGLFSLQMVAFYPLFVTASFWRETGVSLREKNALPLKPQLS